MKKRLFPLFLVLVLCLPLFASCHGSVERAEFTLPEAFDTEKQYEISFWAKNDTNLTQVSIYKEAIADFEKLYPNIKVNLRLYTDYGRIYSDVITNLATDTAPNVCITYPDHIATYKTGKDSVVPLDSLMADEKYGLGGSALRFQSPTAEEIVTEYRNEGFLDGAFYALPFMRSTEFCYVNKTYVEKLGFTLPETLTWDFVWEVSEAATAKNKDGTYQLNGQKVLIPFIYKSTDNMMITWLNQKGADYSTPRGEVKLFHETTEELLYAVAEHTKSGAFSTFKISGYPANYLNAGQCIFAVDSSAGATWMGSDAPLVDIPEDALVDFETEVMLVPQVDPQKPSMISQGPSLCLFNKKDPQEVLASWLFMQFLLTDKVQIAYSQTEGYVPVTEQARRTEAYQDYLSREGEDNELYYDVKLRATKMLLENTSHTFVTPVFNGSASLRDGAGHLIESVTKSTRRKERVTAAYMKALFQDTVSLYRLDQIESGDSKQILGPLPSEAYWLFSLLGTAWLGMGIFLLRERLKKRGKTMKKK